jgi:hypothetical protein
MFARSAFAAAAVCLGAAAAAQQPPAQPQKPSMQQLLSAGYDLKAVTPATGPCGSRAPAAGQTCRREYYYLQSPRKDMLFRCELGAWDGRLVADCNRV